MNGTMFLTARGCATAARARAKTLSAKLGLALSCCLPLILGFVAATADAQSSDTPEVDAAVSEATTPPTNWVPLSPTISPTARAYFAMAYDADSEKIVLFGGFNGTQHIHDTWTFDGTTWKKMFPTHWPAGRAGAQMAYDAVAHRIVLFGGYDGTSYLGDTWLWNGATSQWTRATPQHSPPAETGPMLFTDPNGHADIFGGYNGHFYQLTMWQWIGSDWTQLHPATVPTARSYGAVALNPLTKKVILYGGLGDVNPVNTWIYDGTTWTQQNPGTQPNYVYGGTGVAQPAKKTIITFGGAAGGGPVHATWRWLGTTWKRIFVNQAPPAREGSGAAYDAALGYSVLFGGQGQSTLLNDTWELTP
jgi:hypothetical protein